MKRKLILGKEIVEAPRRRIAGADCWLSEDGSWIVAARKLEDASHSRNLQGSIRRWRAEAKP